MTKLNILVTGAGGPAGVICISSLLARANVFAVDMSALSPGLYLVPASNRALVPAGGAPEFCKELAALCERWQIDVLIPTVDAELLPCASMQVQLEQQGTLLMSSGSAALATVLDKLALVQALEAVIPTPNSVSGEAATPAHVTLPMIAKPRRGSGGRGVKFIENAYDLLPMLGRGDMLLQEYLPGAEYSVDVLVGDQGAIAAVARERMRTDSGVAIVAKVVPDRDLEDYAKRAAAALHLRGIVNVQFKRDAHGVPKLLEINARPPGTLSLTIAAGADMVWWGVLATLGHTLPEQPPIRELAMVRTWQEHYVAPAEIETLHGGPVIAVEQAS